MKYHGDYVSDKYGNMEVNPKPEGFDFDFTVTVKWTDKRLARITRLRLIKPTWEDQRFGFRYYDVSYCYGTLKDGQTARVIFNEQLKVNENIQVQLVALGRKNNVYVKGLGLLEYNVVSIAPQ